MDINCVYNCAYQNEGKCTLTELPPAPQLAVAAGDAAVSGSGCPYYAKKRESPG